MLYVLLGIILFILFLYIWIRRSDTSQTQHAILRTHPILGRIRYFLEMVGPEFRQYWFLNDKESRPVDRVTQETIAKAGKYASTVIGFGSRRDFSKGGFFLANHAFPKNKEEMRVDNTNTLHTYLYHIHEETLFQRKETRKQGTVQPYYLHQDDVIIFGPTCKNPFVYQGFIGISAMSYGALSASAVKAMAQGVALSGGAYMNTGEGGISPHHLSKMYLVQGDSPDSENQYLFSTIKEEGPLSNFEIVERFGEDSYQLVKQWVTEGYVIELETPLIFQLGSGLFGARKNGDYDEETFFANARRPEVKMIEIKLAQGAKVRGGKLPKEKITDEIAAIRGVEKGKDVESPNRNPLFKNYEELLHLINHWREEIGKPIGIKIVCGNKENMDEMVSAFCKNNIFPDFITIDGGEGGTGATYQEMADTLGLPLFNGLPLLHHSLVERGVRDKVKIIASGMLATADKMAIALSLGADCINVARAAMNSVGCINAMKCDTNRCPVGVTSHLPNLEKGVVVQEKRYRVANYLCTMRQGVFALASSCGLESPIEFSSEHIVFIDNDGTTYIKNERS